MISLKVLLIIFVIIIAADKLLTLWNMQILANNNPNYLQAEKNIAARWFFGKFGLIGGTILFGMLTLISLLVVYYSFSFVFNPYKVLWVIFVIYGFTIANNSYYLIKNMGLI